jgi:molecular chaperone DnaK (HSP70)
MAAAAAGLPPPKLVAEPVAAARYFAGHPGLDIGVGSHLVVYDFGAGTFDASVVRRTNTSPAMPRHLLSDADIGAELLGGARRRLGADTSRSTE